jgi:hypothetical protein
VAHRADERRQRCNQILDEGRCSEGGGRREGNGCGERDDGLRRGPSVCVEEEKEGGRRRLIFGLSGEREPGGLAIAVPRGGGGTGVQARVARGRAAATAGPTAAGAAGYR